MSLDSRIKEGTRVLVIGSFSSHPRNRYEKSYFMGFTAKVKYISSHPRDTFPYSLTFDNFDVNKENHWAWSKDEVIYLEDQSYVR